MGILQLPVILPSQVGILPQNKRMVTTDNLATITTAGYLNAVDLQSNPVSPTDVIEVLYSFDDVTKIGTYGVLLVSISNGVITLTTWANPGDVTLPVLTGNFANFDGVLGRIRDLGFSPTDATKTKIVMLNAAPTSGHVAAFTNANGTIGDGGVLGTAAAKAASDNAKATVASVTAATTIGQLAQFDDIVGTIGNSGVLTSAVQLKANIKAATTASIGGAGAGPLTVTVAGLTAASVVVATIESSSNPASVIACTAGTGNFNVTLSADPGASCLLNYVAFVAAQ